MKCSICAATVGVQHVPERSSVDRSVPCQPRALSPEQRAEVQKVLTQEEHCDQPPVEVFHSLLERGVYLCSISTMHRLMREANLSGERRVQRPPSPQPIPRLLATAPNQVWTWDSVP